MLFLIPKGIRDSLGFNEGVRAMNIEARKENIRKQRAEEAMQRLLSLVAAKDYCEKNNLSIEKVEKQLFFFGYDSAIFAQPSDVIPNGLCNDIDTQPKPTLIIRNQDGELIIEETELTRKILAM